MQMSIRLVDSHWDFARFVIYDAIFAIYTFYNTTKIKQIDIDDFKREILLEKNSSLYHNLILKHTVKV